MSDTQLLGFALIGAGVIGWLAVWLVIRCDFDEDDINDSPHQD